MNEYQTSPVMAMSQTEVANIVPSNITQSTDSNPLMAYEKVQIDTQIATAKKYPRNIEKFIAEAQTTIMSDVEIAASCGYKLKRHDKEGKTVFIEGPSIRLAEIMLSAWGNIRIQSFVTEIGKKIRAVANVIDLERNIAVSKEVIRRGTDKYGREFGDDMQIVTANAAQSIALRNAITTVVPKVFVNKLYQFSKQVAIGKKIDLMPKWQKYTEWFKLKGVSIDMIYDWFGVKSDQEITAEMVRDLVALKTAIEDGDTTIEEEFNIGKTTSSESKKPNIEINVSKKPVEEMVTINTTPVAVDTGKEESTITPTTTVESIGDVSLADVVKNLKELLEQNNINEYDLIDYCIRNKWTQVRTSKLEGIPLKRLDYIRKNFDKLKVYFVADKNETPNFNL